MTSLREVNSGQPIVSVTIPILNAERFLAEAVESVIAQTYPSWELLLVEDGSSDGSPEIAQRYERDWPEKIRYFEHPGRENRGMTESRNLGLRNSAGRYIARLDADDVLWPNAFEDQVRILDAHPGAALVYGPVQMWLTWTGDPGVADVTQKFTRVVPLNTIIPPPAAMLALLSDDRNEAVGMFVRRDVIEDVGGYTSDAGFLYEDQCVNVKLFLRHPVIACDRNWYRYRQHADSYCHVMRSRNTYNAGRLRFLVWVGKYLDENGVTDPEIWTVQRRAVEEQLAVVEAEPPPLPTRG
jgi:glycosyltransferase involved in cell wall biosynthesis